MFISVSSFQHKFTAVHQPWSNGFENGKNQFKFNGIIEFDDIWK